MSFIGKFTTVSSSLVWDGSKFISESLDKIVSDRAAAKNAQFLVLAASDGLTDERVFTSSDGISVTDGGAGNNFTVSLNARTGKFNGTDVRFVGGQLQVSAALAAGPGVVINDNGGTLEISSSIAAAKVLVVDFSSNLSDERKIAAGPGIKFLDGGANGLFEVSAALEVGPGLTKNTLADGTLALTASVSQLTAGTAISISNSGGNHTINVDQASLEGLLDAVYADVSGAFVLTTANPALPNGRGLTGGDGISLTDSGAGGTLDIDLDVRTGKYDGIDVRFTGGQLEVSAALLAGRGVSINNRAGALEVSASVASATAGKGITVNLNGDNLEISASLVAGPGITIGEQGNALTVSASIASAAAGPGIDLSVVGTELRVSSSYTYTTADVSSNLTVSEAVSFVDTSAARTITLPSIASTTKGRVYIIKDATGSAAANNITVNVAGGSNIDGSATYVMAINYGATQFVRGETQWHAL